MRKNEKKAKKTTDSRSPPSIPMSTSTDPFSVLDLDVGCTDKDLKSNYYKQARLSHPDKGGSLEEFRKVQQAYEELRDEGRRTEIGRVILLERLEKYAEQKREDSRSAYLPPLLKKKPMYKTKERTSPSSPRQLKKGKSISAPLDPRTLHKKPGKVPWEVWKAGEFGKKWLEKNARIYGHLLEEQKMKYRQSASIDVGYPSIIRGRGADKEALSASPPPHLDEVFSSAQPKNVYAFFTKAERTSKMLKVKKREREGREEGGKR